jgi:hypothetical protein
MIFLSLIPLITVLTSICILTVEPTCNEFECADLVQDSLDCDVVWCYEEGGCGCFCCTVCHTHDHDHVTYHDDSSDSFHAYAKKS